MKVLKLKIFALFVITLLCIIILISFFSIDKIFNSYLTHNNKPLTYYPEKIVIANIAGSNGNYGSGFGNQLFNFSMAYSFAKKIGASQILIKNNSSCEDTIESFKNSSKRCYALHKFGINYPEIKDFPLFIKEYGQEPYIIETFKILGKNKHFFDKYNLFLIQPMFDQKQMVKILKPYKNDIKNLLKYQEPLSKAAEQLLHQIKDTESVSVHIRNGDFVALGRALPLSYQIKAMYIMFNKINTPKFFIFSDDQKQITEYLKNQELIKKDLGNIKIEPSKLKAFYKSFSNAVFVSKQVNHSLEEFYLMSQCKYNITTNSTYSWWAAFLNKNPKKIVISPKNPPKEQCHPKPPSDEKWIEI